MDRPGAVPALDAVDFGGWVPASPEPVAASRVATLAACGLRGAVADSDFATIVDLAADLFATPFAALILATDDRQIRIAPRGIELRNAPLAGSVCAAALASPMPVILHGTGLAPDLPDVRTAIAIRVCAAGGVVIGALCLFDVAERGPQLSAGELRQLRRLATLIEERVEQHSQAIARKRTDTVLQLAQAAANVGTYVSDLEGDARGSPEFYRQFGLPFNVPDLARRWRDCVHPDDAERVFAGVDALKERGATFECDYRIIRADTGEIRWLNTRNQLVFDPDTMTASLTGANIDITDRVRANADLKEGRNLLRSVIDASQDAIFVKDREGRFVLLNGRAAQVLRADADTLIGLRGADVMQPKIAEMIEAADRVVMETGTVNIMDAPYLRNGVTRILQTAVMPWKRDGETCGVVAISRDITELKMAQEASEESRDLLRSVIDQSSDAIFVKDRDSRFVLASAGCATAMGWDPEAMVGRLTEEVFPEVADVIVAADREVMTSRHSSLVERTMTIRGEKRIVQIAARPWRRHGKVSGVVAIARDITEFKQAQAAVEESRDLLRSVIDQSSDAIFVKDRDSRFVLASPGCAETIGRPLEEIVGWTKHEVFPKEMADVVVEMDRARMERGEPGFYEREVIRDGETRILQSAVGPWRRDGEVIGLIAVSRDITEIKRVERALRESEERFRLAAQAIGLGVWDFDAVRHSHQVSSELLDILGLPPGSIPSRAVIRGLIHPEDRAAFARLVRAVRLGDAGDRFQTAIRIYRGSDLQERWITTNGWKTLSDGGDLNRVIVTVRDITEEKTAESRIQWTATHDMLTGLPNRSRFHEDLARSFAATGSGDGRIGLLMLDVDHFKQVNDTLGHDAGDALLRAMGTRLRDVLRPCDLVARLGGDEFAVIVQDVAGEADLCAIVERLMMRLREPFIHGGRILDCRASIGASLYPDHADTAEVLLKNADTALYVAKGAGRGKMMLFRPEMLAETERRTTVLRQVRTALDDQRVVPFYQPKVALATGALVGFEALLRWRSPGAGFRLPGEISAAFEDLDLANALSDRMFERAIADMRRWIDAGLAFGHVAVNASAAEFRRDDFAERLLARLKEANVPTSRLELEVTETVFLGRGAEYVERALNTLCGAGVKIALDDFGTGYASLSHLKQFPVDTIKIDRSFVRDLEDDADDAAIVHAVLNLGQNLGMKVVAEGVETAAQAAYLWAQGCDFGQGYLFGRPLPAGRIPALISNWDANRRWKRPGRKRLPLADDR